jgi:hypothetical protein
MCIHSFLMQIRIIRCCGSEMFILDLKYSHRFPYKYSKLMKKIHVSANICFRANILLRFSHTCKYLLQNICLEANIFKSLSEFHIQVNIHLPLVEDPRSRKTYPRSGSMGSKKHWIPDLDPQHWDYSILFIFIYFIFIFLRTWN